MQPSPTGSTSNLHQQPIPPETPSQKNIFTKVYDAIALKINAVVGKTFNKGETPPQGGLSNFILNSLWGSSKLVTTKEMVTRSRIPNSEMTVSNKNIHHNGTQMRVVEEYKKYDVSPPYPTKKITLNEAQSKILDASYFDGKIKRELQAGLPYNKLSEDAKTAYQTVNLDLVQKHLQNICTIANENRENPEFTKLNALGINHYEIEIKDTLARGLTFIDKDLLNEIEIPSKQLDGTFKMVNYNIERFNLSGEAKTEDLHSEGHPLFFLTPQKPGEAPPLVIARGTLLQDDSLDGAQASIKADGRKDASLKMIANNRELEDKLNDIYKIHGRFEVAGHSLGGNIALNLAVAFPQHIDRVVTISAPQISSAVYKAWTKIPPEERPKVDNLFVEWDAIPCCGRKIIGSAILVEELDDKNKPVKLSNPIERHLKGLFNHKVSYAEIDKSREMKKNTRAFVSFMTKIAGKLISGPTSQAVNKDTDTDEDEPLNQADKLDRKAALAWLQNKRIPPDLEFEPQLRDVIAASPAEIKKRYPLFENFNSYSPYARLFFLNNLSTNKKIIFFHK